MRRWIASSLTVCLITLLPATALPAAESKLSSAPPGTGSHMLSLALLVAGKDGKAGLEPLPAPVARAVNDIKGFLPYTSYEMVDTAVVRGANQIPVRLDLEGPDSRYTAQLQYQLTDDPRRLNFYKFELVRRADSSPAPSQPGRAEEEQPTPKASSREVISTAFSVNVGESIVVGTSRLNGTGKALVVILTVMPIGG